MDIEAPIQLQQEQTHSFEINLLVQQAYKSKTSKANSDALYQKAMDYAKNKNLCYFYEHIAKKFSSNKFDNSWLANKKREAESKVNEYETKIKNLKIQQSYQEVSETYKQLGQYQYDLGDYYNANRNYQRAFEWVQNQPDLDIHQKIQQLQLFNTMLTSEVLEKNKKFVFQLKFPETQPASVQINYNTTVIALIQEAIYQKQYGEALKLLSEDFRFGLLVSNSIDYKFEELACYLAICFLLKKNRKEIKQEIAKENLNNLLSESKICYQIIQHFIQYNYEKCFSMIQNELKSLCDFIPFVIGDLERVINEIKDRFVQDLVQPYQNIHVRDIAKVINQTPEHTKSYLIQLIKNKKLNFRVNDLQNTIEHATSEQKQKIKLMKNMIKFSNKYFEKNTITYIGQQLRYVAEINQQNMLEQMNLMAQMEEQVPMQGGYGFMGKKVNKMKFN